MTENMVYLLDPVCHNHHNVKRSKKINEVKERIIVDHSIFFIIHNFAFLFICIDCKQESVLNLRPLILITYQLVLLANEMKIILMLLMTSVSPLTRGCCACIVRGKLV